MELMPHQERAVEQLANGNVLWGGVGSGKTLTALAYYLKDERDKNVIVITTAKKRDSLDWEADAAKLGIGTDANGTIAGTITVDSWNNASKYATDDYKGYFFIFDEQRVVGSGAWVKAFIRIARRNRWILLSATPGDTWLDYAPIFIANGFYKNITQFRQEHVIYVPHIKFPKVLRYVGVQKLEALRNQVLVEMPYIKHTKRHLNWLPVGYDKDKWKEAIKTRWNPYTDEPMKDVGELFRVMRRISNEDRSRMEQVMDLMKIHPKLIIFYTFNYELELLRSLGDGVALGEWNGHKKQPVPDADKWVYLVQYTSGAEGWNCTETDAMVLYSLTYSYKTFSQALGRIDRLDTKFVDLYYYILASDAPIDVAIKKSLREKRNFSEKGSDVSSNANW